MPTAAATRARHPSLHRLNGVASRSTLRTLGYDRHAVRSQIEAGRWRLVGNWVVLHSGPLTRRQVLTLAVGNHGPSAVLTSFTALTGYGLTGWSRPEIYVVGRRGTSPFQHQELPRIELIVSDRPCVSAVARAETAASAAVRAAGSLASARPACGLIAAVVQQRKASVDELERCARAATRTRHRAAVLTALSDIGQGAQALSEIDLRRLCRRHRLPLPRHQTVRTDSTGRRRYLDAVWDLPGGGTLVVEVDGALHLAQQHWWDDQLRQNDVALSGALILRFPSAVIRHDPELVVAQLRRAFLLSTSRIG